MSTPQQPELRRSGQNPGLNPDAIEGQLEARDRPDTGGGEGAHVPPANRPGAASGQDQDKPDMAAMAAKFGIDEPDPDGERAAAAAQASVSQSSSALASSALADLTSPEMAEQIKRGATVVGTAIGVGLFIVRPIWRKIRG